MGTVSKRRKTAKYACKKIRDYLESEEPDYTSALLLSSIYADMRLRSLLADWVSPSTQDKWEKTSSEILNKISFRGLIILCKKFNLLTDKKDAKNLDDLREKRNKIAHESRLWKKLKGPEKKKIEWLCNFTIEFLERTSS